MTPESRPGGGHRRFPGNIQEPPTPRRDLGPAANGDPSYAFDRRETDATGVIEAVELASMMAEARVAPFLRTTRAPFALGCASVGLRFLNRSTLSLFLTADVLTGQTRSGAYMMVRRWADCKDDVRLDEHMGFLVANRLQADFSGLLQVTVFIRHFD